MGKRLFIIVSIAFLNAFSSRATEPSSLIEQANQAYINGEYSYAIDLYESIVEQKLEASGLYFNLGNAYFKENKFGYAILNYERALRLKPNDENIKFNLEVARSRTVDRINPVPVIFYEKWWKSFYSFFNPNVWAVLVIISLFITLSLLVIFFLSKPRGIKKLSFSFAFFFLVLTLVFIMSARTYYNQLYRKQEAIVMVPRTTAKSAPNDSSPDLFVVHEGSKTRISNKLDDWIEVKLENGNVGWIKKSAVEII